MFKNFLITERARFQFRFESFAFFNHTNFSNPGWSGPLSVTNSTLGTFSFGNIVSATGNRNIQFGAKLMF